MKKVKVMAALWLLLFGFGLGLNPAAAKEKPPPELYRIFNSFNDLETKYRSEKWDESLLALVKVDSDYKAIAVTLQPVVDAEANQEFSRLLATLQKKLARKDAEGAEEPYIEMQKFFLDIMGRYDYPLSPALMVATRYIKKARAELAQGDMKEVAGEMEEIAELQGHIHKALQEKDTVDPDDFFKKVKAVAIAVAGGKRQEAAKVLRELEGCLVP